MLGRPQEALEAYDEIIVECPWDIVARGGRADTLKLLGRPEEALREYDEIIADHPWNIVARGGRADTLKLLGRPEEALREYDEIIADHPWETYSRNGRSCVLVELQRYKEAMEHLPNGDTLVTLQDWIGYHIRGMILLRLGNVHDAIRIFERDVAEAPIPSSKEYFRTALAVALLRRQKYEDASRLLQVIKTPMLQPQTDVLRLHSFGAMNQTEEANAAFQNLTPKPWSISDELIDELHRRYILKEELRRSDDWVFEQEVGTLLLIANQQSTISSYQGLALLGSLRME